MANQHPSIFVPLVIGDERLNWCIDRLRLRGLQPNEQNLRMLIEELIDQQSRIPPVGGDCVYELCYPESMGGHPFYIGMGSPYRYKDHAAEAKRGVKSAKCDVIRSIWAKGEQVVVKITRDHLTGAEALQAEKERIYEIGYENLVNVPPRTKDRSYKGPNKGPVYLF